MGVQTGQKFLCECGAKVKYTRGCPEPSAGPFVCTCGATGTETRDQD